MDKTLPKPLFSKDYKPNPANLAAGRYGTEEMIKILGEEQTFEESLFVQGQAALILSQLHPNIVPPEHAKEIFEKASLNYIDPDRIRKIEADTAHDIMAINQSLEEKVSRGAAAHINKFKTSADTTQPAKALQIKAAMEVIIDSTENLRDIVLEKSKEWRDIPAMETTHLYDALPSVAGRAFAHYGEMLQSNLKVMKFFYENSIIGKWADATGNHHSATALGVDGIKLQEEYCKSLKLGFMDANAQIPGLEFEADIFYSMSRVGETMNNIAKYIATGRGDDVNIFINLGKKQKGSSAMPHKDAKRGNPTSEEQNMSVRNEMVGNLVTAMINCEFPYARNLAASANTRINLEDGFKFLDQGVRKLAKVVYNIGLREERSIERVLRSYGCCTSQQVMTYLTDHRKTENPMTRGEAHDLMGELATHAWDNRIPFVEVLLKNKEVTSRLKEPIIKNITDPLKYIGQSKEIIDIVYKKYHGKKTL